VSQLRQLAWVSTAETSQRDAADDFFCLRYQVWYPSVDCAFRTRHRTCEGCNDCEQGRFNLKRHAPTLLRAGARPLPLIR